MSDRYYDFSYLTLVYAPRLFCFWRDYGDRVFEIERSRSASFADRIHQTHNLRANIFALGSR